MGTRSTIGIERSDGSVAQIYCNWDGYYSHNGRILLESYTTEDRIMQLIALGDLSSLGPELGEKHPFAWHQEDPKTYDQLGHVWCTAYGRDRGEPDCDPRLYQDFAAFQEEGDQAEYNYLFRKGKWLTLENDRWVKLAPRVRKAMQEETA